MRVSRRHSGVCPRVTPDTDGVSGVSGMNDARERLERDRSRIPRDGKLSEEAREVENSCAEMAPVALARVDVTEQAVSVPHGKREGQLLTVGMKSIEMEQHVVSAEILDEGNGLGSGVEQVALVPIDVFDSEHDTSCHGLCRDSPQHC